MESFLLYLITVLVAVVGALLNRQFNQFDEFKKSVNARFDKIDGKFEKVNSKIDTTKEKITGHLRAALNVDQDARKRINGIVDEIEQIDFKILELKRYINEKIDEEKKTMGELSDLIESYKKAKRS